MKIEWQKFEFKADNKLRNFKPFEPLLPLYKISDDGPRILVVLDRVSTADFHSGRLLDNDRSGKVFKNLISFVMDRCGQAISEILVVNYEFLHIRNVKDGDAKSLMEEDFKKRIHKLVKKYQPDRVLLMGSEPTRKLAPHPKLPPESDLDSSVLVGRVRKVNLGINVPVVSTHSLATLATDLSKKRDGDDDYGELKIYPNLLGEVGHHFENLVYGKNRYTIVDKFDIVNVDTLKKFKAFFKELKAAKRVSIDTEGENLNRIANKLLTAQFSMDGKTAYFLPMFHPQTPFTAKELNYIRRKLKWYFEFGTSTYHIGAHYKYDLMQFRRELNLRWYNHRIYDIAAGEYCLDENRKFRSNIGLSAYSLDQMVLERGCFGYHTKDGMGKSEREDMKNVPLSRIGPYGCKDVIYPFQVCDFQIQEAKRRGSDYSGFVKTVVELISDITHCFAVMEQNGLLVDRNYLVVAMSPNGKFNELLKKITGQLYKSKAVRKANAKILEERGVPTRTLAGGTDNAWVFDISNNESQQTLFFDVLKLASVEDRKDGGGKVGKPFQKAHAGVEEVDLFVDYQKAIKLKNTFIDGFFKKLITDPDMKLDGRLRPHFMFLTIITGRAGASNPSLQQLPSRESKSSKYLQGITKLVKRQFVAPLGSCYIKADFSAHEVRNWGIIAGDDLIANSFRVGLRESQTYRLLKVLDDTLKTEWAVRIKMADIHRVNYAFFYGKNAQKVTEEERDSIKQVVFGVMYGMGAKSLAETIGCSEKQAQDLIDLLFEKFHVGGDWIKEQQRKGKDEFTILSPLGRVRHLWGYMHWNRTVWGMMDRRGPNSIVQGTSSDEGFLGGRQLQRLCWELFEKKGQPFSLRPLNAVHDSSELETSLIELPISVYLTEHAYTTMVHKRCRETFNFPMNVSLEMKMEIGGSLGETYKWDFRKDTLLALAEKTIAFQQKELKYDLNMKKLMKRITHNADICDKLRRAEIIEEKKIDVATEIMHMTKDNSLDLGLRFAKEAA